MQNVYKNQHLYGTEKGISSLFLFSNLDLTSDIHNSATSYYLYLIYSATFVSFVKQKQ